MISMPEEGNYKEISHSKFESMKMEEVCIFYDRTGEEPIPHYFEVLK